MRRFSGAENPVTTHFYTGQIGLIRRQRRLVGGLGCAGRLAACLMIGLGLSAGIGHYLQIMVFQRISSAAPFFLCASGPYCLAPPFLVNYRMLCR